MLLPIILVFHELVGAIKNWDSMVDGTEGS